MLFLINAIWHTGQFLAPTPDRVGGFIRSLIGVDLSVGAGFLGWGWTMIQCDHVGVDPLPSTRYRERVERPDMEAPERGVPA